MMSLPTRDSRLFPVIDAYSAPFYAAAAHGKLAIPFCAGCRSPCWTPRSMCPLCHTTEFEWTDLDPTGTIWSYCVVHPPVLPELAGRTPFVVAVVALARHPHVHVIGDVAEPVPAHLGIGAPVTARFEFYDTDVGIVHWTLDPAPKGPGD